VRQVGYLLRLTKKRVCQITRRYRRHRDYCSKHTLNSSTGTGRTGQMY